MVSNQFSKNALSLLLLFAPLLLVLQGCVATRDWVAEQFGPRDKRAADAEGRLDQMGNRVSATENRLASAEGKIGQVDARTEKILSTLGNLQLEKRLVLDLRDGANFGFNSAALPDQAKKEIDAFLSDLKGDLAGTDSAIFVVAGHTDSKGTDDYNYELGRKRAESVTKYLILQKKVDPMRLVTVSYGKSAPAADNSSREGRGKNRRVEILVYREGITTGSPADAASQTSPSKSEAPQDRVSSK